MSDAQLYLRSLHDRISEQARSSLMQLRTGMPARLYHYTTAAGLLGIVSSGRLWATDYRFLNDSAELKYGHDLLLEIISSRKQRYSDPVVLRLLEIAERASHPDAIGARIFIACLSAAEDDLNQWRVYGPGQSTFSIGFVASELGRRERPSTGEQDLILTRVEYDRIWQEKYLGEIVDHVLSSLLEARARFPQADQVNLIAECSRFLRAVVSDYLCAFKASAFSAEQEWRLLRFVVPGEEVALKFRTGPYGLTPYTILDPSPEAGPRRDSLPIDEVWHSPAAYPDNVQSAVRDLLTTHRYRADVRASRRTHR